MQLARVVAVELHEHEVPDFDVAVAVGVRRAGRAAGNFLAVVVKDFGAGAAGAGLAHLPEIVRTTARLVTDTRDAVSRHADFIGPDVVGLIVGLVDGDPEFFLRQFVNTGQQFPREVDGVLLEVIAETEIAEHFEEGVVARRVTDVFEIVVLAAGAHAALRSGGAFVVALLVAEEEVLELHHAGVGEEQRWIIARHQRTGGDDGVALALEIVEELLADLAAFHGSNTGIQESAILNRSFREWRGKSILHTPRTL